MDTAHRFWTECLGIKALSGGQGKSNCQQLVLSLSFRIQFLLYLGGCELMTSYLKPVI